MPIRVEGFAITSEDGMVADGNGQMPSALVIDADQQFLSTGLDRSDLIVHGRNSHECQPTSMDRRRLIATRKVDSISPCLAYPKTTLWNPAGISLEQAASLLGIDGGTVAILGGPGIYELFLPRYNVFHLSCVAGLRLPSGRGVFSYVPALSAQFALAASGLKPHGQQPLDVARGVTVTTWARS